MQHRELERVSFSRQDFLLKSCEKKKKNQRKHLEKQNSAASFHQQVSFLWLVQMEIFAFETHLHICIFIDRALEGETCSFSKKTKIASCFCLYFSILVSKESVIGIRLLGKCQAGSVSSFWQPAWVDGE